MENDFEKYIGQNQEQFEKGAPSPRVWQKLESKLIQHQEKKVFALRQRIVRWSVAASIVFILGAALVFYFIHQGNNNKVNPIVKNNLTKKESMPGSNTRLDSQKIVDQKLELQKKLADNPFPLKQLPGIPKGGKGYRQSLFYYTSLVEQQQKKIELLQKTNPDVYRELKKSIDDLNAIYLKLKDKLPTSIDQKKILMDMIDNLKIQAMILNNQLQLLEKETPSNSHNDDETKDSI